MMSCTHAWQGWHILLIYFNHFSNKIMIKREKWKYAQAAVFLFFFYSQQTSAITNRISDKQNTKQWRAEDGERTGGDAVTGRKQERQLAAAAIFHES